MEVHDHPKQRMVAPSSKRASPIPDSRAESRTSKRPRRNAPQKPMTSNSRTTPIVINDEEDEISDSSQQLPPSPQAPRVFTNGVGSSPHLPSSLDSVTDPIEPWMMDTDSTHQTPHKGPVLFTNNSSPANISPAPPTAHLSPRPTQPTQASIRSYMLSVSQQRDIEIHQTASTVYGLPTRQSRDVWRSKHRPPTPGPPNHERQDTPSSESPAPVSATITTVSSDSDERGEKEGHDSPQVDLSCLALRKVRYEFNDDSYIGPRYSSPLPHKKTGQGSTKAETLTKHGTFPVLLPNLKQEEFQGGRKASPGIMDSEEIAQVKPNLSDVPTLPAPQLPLSSIKGRGKRPTIAVLIEKTVQGADGLSKPNGELRGGQATQEFRDEIPSSQPSPPPVSRHASPDPDFGEPQDVIGLHGGMRETRYKRTAGQARNAQQPSSELSDPPLTPPSPDRPKKKKQDVEVVVDDNEEGNSIEELSPPSAVRKSSSSKPKRSAPRGRGVAVARKKEKTPGNGKKAGISKWVTAGQNEEGGEREEVMMTRERRRRVGRG